jgi:hypothetical protein
MDARRKSGCHEGKLPLSSAPYAESDRTQQNSKSRLETVQDHRDRQSHAATRFAPAFAFLEERQAQAALGQVGRSRQNGHVSNQVEHAVCLSIDAVEAGVASAGGAELGAWHKRLYIDEKTVA